MFILTFTPLVLISTSLYIIQLIQVYLLTLYSEILEQTFTILCEVKLLLRFLNSQETLGNFLSSIFDLFFIDVLIFLRFSP